MMSERDTIAVETSRLLSVSAERAALRLAFDDFLRQHMHEWKSRQDGSIVWAEQELSLARQGVRLQRRLQEADEEYAAIRSELQMGPEKTGPGYTELEVRQFPAYVHKHEVIR
jgi:hypothetical protein